MTRGNRNIRYDDITVDVELEKAGIWVDAKVSMQWRHEGDHPFGTSELLWAEIEGVEVYGDDGDAIAYNGEYDAEILAAAERGAYA